MGLPALLSLVMIAQGINKILHHDMHGRLIVVLGILCLLIVPIWYFVFLRV